MFTYYRGSPTDHSIVVEDGRIFRQGRGISCIITRRRRVMAVPGVNLTTHMSLVARTSDMQPIGVYGDLVYKVSSPGKAAGAFDFTVDPKTNEHVSDGPAALRRAVTFVTRDLVRDEISRLSVESLLGREPEIGRGVLIRLRHSPRLRELGISPVDVFVKDLKANPDTVKAIEGKKAIRCAPEVTMAQGIGTQLPWKPKEDSTPSDSEVSAGMECTDSCPFRHMCGDYMNDFRDGKAWCTLFREFST